MSERSREDVAVVFRVSKTAKQSVNNMFSGLKCNIMQVKTTFYILVGGKNQSPVPPVPSSGVSDSEFNMDIVHDPPCLCCMYTGRRGE